MGQNLGKKLYFLTFFPLFRRNIATNQFCCATISSNMFYMLYYIRISQNFRLPFTWPKFVPLCNRKFDENLSIQYDIFRQYSFHFQSIKRDLIFSFWFGVESMLKSKTSLSLRKICWSMFLLLTIWHLCGGQITFCRKN